MLDHPSIPSEKHPAVLGDPAVLGARDLREGGVELLEYARSFRKRWWAIALVLVVALSLTALFTFTATPMYSAEALIRIERGEMNVIDIESLDGEVTRLGGAGDYYNTQYAILSSRKLASEVLSELEIHGSERLLGADDRLSSWIREQISKLGVQGFSMTPRRSPEGERLPLVIDRYLRQLSVEPVADSRLVKLRFVAADPDLAALVVNTHARAFIMEGLDFRASASSEAGSFLEKSLADLRERVSASQRTLGEFRREHDIVSLNDKADVVIDGLEDMNRRLSGAESDRIAQEAEMQLVRKRDYETLPAVINSPLIGALKEELAPLEREYAALRPAVTPEYPGLRALQARIDESRRRIDVEVRKIVEGIESDYMAALRREEEVRSQVETRKKQALQLKDDSVEYAILLQDVETALSLYDSVRQRSEETRMVGELASSNVFVVDAAYAPQHPTSPRKGQNLILGALIGLFGGLGLVLVLEVLDGRLRSVREVSLHLKLPTLGVVPTVKRRLGVLRRQAPLQHVWRTIQKSRSRRQIHAPPSQPIQEIYRAIRTDLLLTPSPEPPSTFLFSSARHSEGRTTTAVNMAIAFSQLGAPVLLIDADLRKPSCHDWFGLPESPGLSEMLSGRASEIRKIEIAERDLFFLPSGAQPENAADLLGSMRMRETLTKLRERFDYIVIDSPPLTSVSDGLLLSSMVDGVVLVVDPRQSPRRLLKTVCGRFALARSQVLGVVLNRADSFYGGDLFESSYYH